VNSGSGNRPLDFCPRVCKLYLRGTGNSIIRHITRRQPVTSSIYKRSNYIDATESDDPSQQIEQNIKIYGAKISIKIIAAFSISKLQKGINTLND